MLRILGLKQERALAEGIEAYDHAIAFERSQLEKYRRKLADSTHASPGSAPRDANRRPSTLRWSERRLPRRIAYTEALIRRMERIRDHFEMELSR